MKNQVRQRKPIPFSWRSWDEMMQKWSLKRVTQSVWVNFSWERNGEDSEQSQKFKGKTKKKNNLKTVFKMQNMCFSWLRQVASQSPRHPPKHFKSKDLKKFAKCIFATRSLTHERVMSRAMKISMYSLWLDLPLANKSPKTTRELAAVACNLDDPWPSCQNRATLFLKIFNFCKNKILSKNT